jgi:hypothetical protein
VASLIVGGVILLALIASVIVYQSAPPTPQPELVEIHPTVKASAVELTIKNGDPFPYENVEVRLNPSGLLQTGHTAHLGKIEPGKTVRVSLIDFADDDNERFQPLKTKLTTVRIFAKVNGKDAVATLGF